MQEGERAKFNADAEIAQAQRDFALRQAQYQAEIETQKAKAAQAGPLSEATARQAVVAEEVKVERTRTQEMIAVQEQEVARKQKELQATVIKPAEADREAAIVRAEAQKQAAILESEGRRAALIAMAEAEQEKLRKEGVGRAAAVEAEGKAEAAKIEAIGLAQAKAIEAQGSAEAIAILRKADAWKQFNEAAKLQTILERLPAIIQASAGVFGAVAAPLGNIDKVVVIDHGGNGNASSGMNRLANTGPAVVFNLLQQLQATPTGLTTDEAKRRLRLYGPNSMVQDSRFAGLLTFLRLFANPLVVILLVAALLAIAGRHIGARWRHTLWILVLVRLAIPFAPPSSFSIFNFLPVQEPAAAKRHGVPLDQPPDGNNPCLVRKSIMWRLNSQGCSIWQACPAPGSTFNSQFLIRSWSGKAFLWVLSSLPVRMIDGQAIFAS